MLRRLLGYFLNGIIFIVPLAITVFIIYNLFVFLDDLLPVERQFPGSGLLTLLLVVTLIGFLGSTFIATPIRNYFNRLVERIPLVKTLYTAITDMLSAFVGQKKRFNKPVLVKWSEHLERVGFVTDEELAVIGSPGDKVAVYFPHSYTYTGNLYIVPSENVTYLDKKPSEVMKYIVSGGITDAKQNE